MAKRYRWTEEDLRDLGCGKHLEQATKKGRYGNVKRVTIDGHKFASTREGTRYSELKLMERAGVINDLELQPRFPITIAGIEIRYARSNRHLTYIADFRYYDLERSKWVIEDTKMQSGHRTDVYKIKRALMLAMGNEIIEV